MRGQVLFGIFPLASTSPALARTQQGQKRKKKDGGKRKKARSWVESPGRIGCARILLFENFFVFHLFNFLQGGWVKAIHHSFSGSHGRVHHTHL